MYVLHVSVCDPGFHAFTFVMKLRVTDTSM